MCSWLGWGCVSFDTAKEVDIVGTTKPDETCGLDSAVELGTTVDTRCVDVGPQETLSHKSGTTETCASCKGVAADAVTMLPPPREDFDYSKSTEDFYGVSHFVGSHADIRPLLDYTWHRKYSDERVQVQDQLIDMMCSEDNQRHDNMLPWVVFTAGAMGAGKGYVTRWMDEKGYMPLDSFTVVDPDAIRHALPEWAGYVQRNPSTAGDLTQKEAGCIAEIIGYKALRQRSNVVFDGSLRDVVWYKKYFAQLREQFPGVRIMILHIVADRDEVVQRAEARAKETGREIPRQTLFQSLEEVPHSVSQLAPVADFCCRVRNYRGREPELEREPNARSPNVKAALNWEVVQDLWRSLDLDGDGELSKEEISAAIAQGMLTVEVLNSMDLDGDGRISLPEIHTARSKARAAATRRYK